MSGRELSFYVAAGLSVFCLGSLFGPGSSAASFQKSKAVADQASKPGTRLVILGTGAGPVPRARRSAPASMVQVGGRSYLVDAGAGAAVQLARAGIKQDAISTIFLTHLHYDHTGGLPELLAYYWATRPKNPIEIYGPPATETVVETANKYLAIPLGIHAAQMPPTAPLGAIVRTHEIDAAAVLLYRDELVSVRAVDNSHFATMPSVGRPAGAKRSYSFRFDTPDRSIVFTGDTGPSAAVEALAKGADVLVSEVTDPDAIAAGLSLMNAKASEVETFVEHLRHEHLVPEEIGRMASRAGVKMVILTHIGPGFDNETDFRQYTDGVRKFYSGPVLAAWDGSEF